MSDYRLLPNQVPAPPNDTDWPQALRWCVAVMNPDDAANIAFASSLLSHAIERGLTEKQIKYARRLLNSVVALWQGGGLFYQRALDTTNVTALKPRLAADA